MASIGRLLSKREKDKRSDSPSTRKRISMYLSTNPNSNGDATANRSVESVDPNSVADFHGLLCDTSRPNSSEEPKVKTLRRRIITSKSVLVKDENILWALRCNFSSGDIDAAYDLLNAMTDASEGIIITYDPQTKLLGAVNRQAVTCYLDATLFAMFSRLDSFEAMLYNNFDDQSRNRLAFMLRLWVNLLRAGKLVTTDITKKIQEALVECGWEDAGSLHQQDASEAFTFITEKLKLPLMTLKMDMYHAGKQDEDDHRFINERLLEVAIPANENGEHKDIRLEDCLEDYFNNRIEVRRFLERRSTLHTLRDSDLPSKSNTIHVETVEVDDSDTPLTPITTLPSHMSFQKGGVNRGRAASIIQERFVPEDGKPVSNGEDGEKVGRQRKGSIRKEVLMPAWQFFSLIPWYTNNAPSNDAQVAAHFSSRRPILGLCLKRYSMTPGGRAIRLNTFIDIPIEIGLPHFIQDDKLDENGPLYGNFKLSLQSVVCHRGSAVDSGHYVSLVRASTLAPAAEPEQWMRFDDLATQKISLIDIHQALRDETPYLLFYQIIPIDGDPGNVMAGEKPPPYAESHAHDSGVSGVSVSPEPGKSASESATPSTRPSFELPVLENSRSVATQNENRTTTSARPSLELPVFEDYRSKMMQSESRRPSTIVISEALSFGKSRSNSQERAQQERRKSASFGRSLSRGSKRLSITLASITGTNKGKEERPMSIIPEPGHPADDDEIHDTPEDALAKLNGEVPIRTDGGNDISDHEHRERGRRRDKSKNRLSKVYMGRSGSEKPDRECIVM